MILNNNYSLAVRPMDKFACGEALKSIYCIKMCSQVDGRSISGAYARLHIAIQRARVAQWRFPGATEHNGCVDSAGKALKTSRSNLITNLKGAQQVHVDGSRRLFSCGADCSLKLRPLPTVVYETI